jgi:hypothetical protein
MSLLSRSASDEGDERVADVPMADRGAETEEFEATPMEAACKMLFGEHEAPRMIQALSAARARERDARARRTDAETPETQSRLGSQPDLRRVGPPLVRPTSCQSWDWNDDGSPRESLTGGGGFRERNEGDSFKRVYSLCNLDAGLLKSNDGSRANSRGGSVSGGAAFARGLHQHRIVEEGANDVARADEISADAEGVDIQLDDSRSKRARLQENTDAPRDAGAGASDRKDVDDDADDASLRADEGVALGPEETGGNDTKCDSGRSLFSSRNGTFPVNTHDSERMAVKTQTQTRFEAELKSEPDRGAVARARDAEEARAKTESENQNQNRVRVEDVETNLSRPLETSAPKNKNVTVTTRRVSRESEDSAAMRELRREWASMRGIPQRSASAGRDLSLDQNANGVDRVGAGATDAAPVGLKTTTVVKASVRSTPSIKQRLAEALTPTKSPGGPCTFTWRFNARVTGLNLSNASIGPSGAAFLAEALRPRRNGDGSYSHNTYLRSLNLEFNNLGCEGVTVIAEALKPLWVPMPAGSGNEERDADSNRQKGRWVANDALERLNLNFCEVGARGAAALASALAPRLSEFDQGRWRHYGGLTHLSLFHNRLGAEGARLLAEALAPRAQPSVFENTIRAPHAPHGRRDVSAETLACARDNGGDPVDDFAFHPTLRSLNVGRNQLGDVGLARIARAFAPVRLRDGSWMYNQTFKHLHANANSCLSQEGPLALSESLAPRQNPDAKWAFAATLSTIHLANVLLGEEGGGALADVFRPRRCENASSWTFPSNLRVLNLSKTGLGDGGAKHIADALRPRREPCGRWTHNPRLRELHLGGATIGVEGANALAEAIKPRRNGSGGVAGFDDDDALEDVEGPWGRKCLRNSYYPSGYRAPRWTFNVALQVLDLRDNVLGPEGVAALAKAVAPVLDEDEREFITKDDLSSLSGGSESEEAETLEGKDAKGKDGVDAMETDHGFGSPTVDTDSNDACTEKGKEKPRRWLFGGALAVLNLEFNDAGAEGVAALATALAPRWCVGPRRARGERRTENASVGAFSFGRVPVGNGSGNTNGTSLPGSNAASRPASRPTSARVASLPSYEKVREVSGSLSPGSSLAGSPAATPRAWTNTEGIGDVRGACHGHATGTLGTRSGERSLPGSAPGSRPQSANRRSPLAVASGKGVSDEKTKQIVSDVDASDPFAGCLSTEASRHPQNVHVAHWAANETLRALGVGGNRAGDEGANALAKAVKPRRNPDGSWTATSLVKLDASENAIGTEGLFALAEAIDPKRSESFDSVKTRQNDDDLARSFAATSVTAGPGPNGDRGKEDPNARNLESSSPRGVVGSGVSSGVATPSPGNEPNPLVSPRNPDSYETYDVHSGLRKLDLARNNSDENVRERFNELREKLRRAPCAHGCDVCI